MYKFWQIHLTTKRNPFNKSNLDKIRQQYGETDWQDKAVENSATLFPVYVVSLMGVGHAEFTAL